MNSEGSMHQQFLKDFIHSLQSGSEDSHSLSESSLNPNAAEFVPSYMKDNVPDLAPCQQKKSDEVTSTTTLVRQELIGDAQHVTRLDAQSRMQRQLFSLMDQMGNHEFPIEAMQFSLSPNAQGINVQFMMPDRTNRVQLDEQLCLASGLRVEIGQHEALSSAGHALAAQFLNRMCATLNEDNNKPPIQAKEPTICPRCTALPKKHSYTELEIERQIEDIKAFERLINDDAGTRYQEAFKELCHKLGLTTPEEQMLNSGSATAAAASVAHNNEVYAEQAHFSLNEGEELSSYDWDSFTPEFDHMQVYRLTTADPETKMHQQNEPPQEEISSSNDNNEQVEQSSSLPAMSITTTATTTNLSSAYPKLYKLAGQLKSPNLPPRKIIVHKEKESKLQRYRFSSPVRNGLVTSTTARKLAEPLYLSGNRPKTLSNKTAAPKSDLVGSQVLKTPTKHQSETNKHNKSATLGRSSVSNAAQAPSPKQTPATAGAAPRVVVPRSTHASQMRQSEVKRRLSLMRGDESDVQFNEYLFK